MKLKPLAKGRTIQKETHRNVHNGALFAMPTETMARHFQWDDSTAIKYEYE